MSYYIWEISENTVTQESIKLKDKKEHRSKKIQKAVLVKKHWVYSKNTMWTWGAFLHCSNMQMKTERIWNICELIKTARKTPEERNMIIPAGRQDKVCSVGQISKSGRPRRASRWARRAPWRGHTQMFLADWTSISTSAGDRRLYSLASLSPCDESTNNKSLSRKVTHLEMQ